MNSTWMATLLALGKQTQNGQNIIHRTFQKESALSGSIVLQFAGCDDIMSDAIKLFERGWTSHVDSVMPDGSLLGARLSGGVAIRPPNYEKFARTLVVRLQTADSVVDAYYRAIVSQVGKPYDVTAILGFMAARNWRDKDHWMCSEICAWALEQANFFPHPIAATDNTITPRDLLLLVSPFSADATMVG